MYDEQQSETVNGNTPGTRRVETHSTDYIPGNERHGTVWQQAPFWFMINANVTTALTGVIGAGLGLGIVWSLVAITAGGLFGTFFTAFHAAQGPQLGLPQMIQSRVQFGSRGLVVPLAVVVLIQCGFGVFFVILGANSLSGMTTPHNGPYEVLICSTAAVIAIIGHDLVHRVQRYLSILVLVTFALVTVGVLSEVDLGGLVGAGGFAWTAFLAQFGASAAYQIALAPMVSDYTRYLPKETGTRRVVAMVFLGSLGSATWLEMLGATVTTALPHMDTVEAIRHYGDAFIGGLGWITLAVTLFSVIGVLPTTFYSAAINALSMVDAFRPLRPSARSRVLVIAALTALTYLATVGIPDHYLNSFSSFLSLLAYLLVPWTAVNLVDFYLIRHSSYAISEILAPGGGVYGRWGVRGLGSYAIGLAVMVPFFSTSLFTGPAARALGGADISPLIGLPVSALLYWLLMRGADLSAERDAIVRDPERLLALHDRAAVPVLGTFVPAAPGQATA
ncbi:purine-cytosine permease family protein [Catenulispora rubra]|uniref:purine-cytosine permease family protein n=1 Tax=Catenulispora rubra TaxID=280293 RepID=UPI0018923743|nr:cytosine permease [Catenulispora rubra]